MFILGFLIGLIVSIIILVGGVLILLWRYLHMFEDTINEAVKEYISNWDVITFINKYKGEWITIAETKMDDPATKTAIAGFIEELKAAIGL